MDRQTTRVVESLSNQQARFLLRWTEANDAEQERTRQEIREVLAQRTPVAGPQTALAYMIDNRCPDRIGMLAHYIGLYPKEAVIDHLIACRAANVGSRQTVIAELLDLFANAAATYAQQSERHGFSAAVGRQVNYIGAALYRGAQRAAES